MLCSKLLEQDFDAPEPEIYAEPAIIFRGLQSHIFKNARDVGITFQREFDPVPLPTLAALLCAVSYLIDARDIALIS